MARIDQLAPNEGLANMLDLLRRGVVGVTNPATYRHLHDVPHIGARFVALPAAALLVAGAACLTGVIVA